MLHLDVLASWSMLLFLLAIYVLGRLVEPDMVRLTRILAEQNGITRPIALSSLGGAFAGIAVLAALGQPLLGYGFFTDDGGVTLWGLVLGATILAGCLIAAIVAGNRRLYRVLVAAEDVPDHRLPQFGPALLSGQARPLTKTVTAPWTGADALVYDARRTAALSEDLSDGRPEAVGYVDGSPFCLDTEAGEVVVDPDATAISLHGSEHGAHRIEPGDRVSVLCDVDHEGTDRPEVTASEDGICYLTDWQPATLRSELQTSSVRGPIVVALTTLGPILVAAYLAI